MSLEPKREQGFIVFGHFRDFLHQLLRRVVKRSDLPDEFNWEKLLSFDLAMIELFGVPDFMQKKTIFVPRD